MTQCPGGVSKGEVQALLDSLVEFEEDEVVDQFQLPEDRHSRHSESILSYNPLLLKS